MFFWLINTPLEAHCFDNTFICITLKSRDLAKLLVGSQDANTSNFHWCAVQTLFLLLRALKPHVCQTIWAYCLCVCLWVGGSVCSEGACYSRLLNRGSETGGNSLFRPRRLRKQTYCDCCWPVSVWEWTCLYRPVWTCQLTRMMKLSSSAEML